MKHMNILLCLLATVLLTGCTVGENDAERVAHQWGEAYFNYQFKQALDFSTPESERWLRFAASNITQADLDALQKNGQAVVSLDGYYAGSDTTGTAYLNVSNWLCPDSIGHAGSLQEQATFQVSLVKRDGRWMVRMEGLPRSERQSRD
jgi:hypothetical protein